MFQGVYGDLGLYESFIAGPCKQFIKHFSGHTGFGIYEDCRTWGAGFGEGCWRFTVCGCRACSAKSWCG